MQPSESTLQGDDRSEPPAEAGPLLVRVLHTGEIERCVPNDSVGVERNDLVILDSRYGPDLGRVLGATGSPEGGDAGEQREIFRRASDEDVNTYRANLQREERLFEQCRELAAEHAPDMKPVACHLLIGEPKLVLFFTAEGRIDFRALLKAMNANLRMRVELRQIGARDVSRMFGGMGPCGGSFCCSTFLRKPPSVSIRMAKTQNLSLSSTKASGPCGRLLCCLSYEHEFYQEARRAIPAEGTELTVDGRDVRVVEVNPVSGVLWVRDSEGGYFTVRTCRFRYDQERKEWQVTDCPSDS